MMSARSAATQIRKRFPVSIAKSFCGFAAALLLLMLALSCAGVAIAQGQGKGTSVSKVERLNRAPVNKEILRVQLPRPAVEKLPNGLTVLLLEDHKLPTVAFSMWIRPGQLADPADLPGLASFTAEMLTEGTAQRNSEQIANEVDSLGATLTASSRFGSSYASVNASGLINDAPKILDLMSDVVLHPAFPESELAKFKQREEADLEQQISSPAFLAQKSFRRVLYGDGPLGVTSATKESIEKVTQDDLKRFHSQHYVPGNSILGVTGDFKSADMRALIEKYFGAWSVGEVSHTLQKGSPEIEGRIIERPATKITLVDRPGSVQTYIIVGDRGIKRDDPEYYNLVVMNQIEGGGPQARLFLDLREEHSLTYGSYSTFNAEVYPGDWYGQAPVRTQVTGEAMERFLYEFKKINDEPVPQNELDDARRAIVAGFALSLERPAQILNGWLTVQHFGLPADYWDKYPDRIANVNAAQVQAAAKKFIDLADLQWVCVGDRKQIQDVLAKYGTVSVVDATGKPEN
ncbi:MAG TPA: pitrilysin family protein [Candidatus Limnocylindrales bacterium]|nr:pitrilysin family protein [Candidatus Limnocylindrales bacterium]